MAVTETKSQTYEIDLILLIRKMLSYKSLMLICLLLGIAISLVWGLILYKPSYDISASYKYKVSNSYTLSNMYGVQYLSPEDLVVLLNHPDTVTEYLKETRNDEKITEEKFLKPFSAKYDNGIISINVDSINEQAVALYKDYVSYCIKSFNKDNQDNVISQLNSAKSLITEELKEVEKKVFEADTVNASNYSHSITLNDMIKSIDIQIAEIEEGAVRVFSDYEITKVSSRAKNMVIIVLVALFLGVLADFILCLFDTRIYFSEDINNNPDFRKILLSCIPLYRDNRISEKEYINILSKLPDEVTSVSVSEISDHAGAIEIANGMNKLSSSIKVEYSGCLVSDADILSDFSKYSINLIVLRVGIDTINQARNISQDCKVKGVDNFFFVLYGLEPSDKMVTRFEEDSHYIKYPLFSFRTLKQHYRKYYELQE